MYHEISMIPAGDVINVITLFSPHDSCSYCQLSKGKILGNTLKKEKKLSLEKTFPFVEG